MASFKVNKVGVYHHTRDLNGPSGRHVRELARRARNLAVSTAPKDTYRLASSIGYRVRTRSNGFTSQVGVFRPLTYPPRYPKEGGQPRPNTATVLRMLTEGVNKTIHPKGDYKLRYGVDGLFRGERGANGEEIFRSSVRGMAENDFLIEACRRAWPYPVAELD